MRVDPRARARAAGRFLGALRRDGRERETVVQAGKAALAAVLALLVARATGGPAAEHAFLAPYAAVLAVATTVRRSWSGAARQAAMVVAGVLLAFTAARVLPGVLVGLAAVVVVGLLAGRWRRFGDDGYWVAITALLLLVNGSAAEPGGLLSWVLFSVTGSVIGALVNTVVLPPLHLRDARAAMQSLAAQVTGVLREMADGVGEGWGPTRSVRWVHGARGLRLTIRRTDDAVWDGRDSARWNPRRRGIDRTGSPLTEHGTVERFDRLTERVVHVAVLLHDLAEGADQPPDPGLAELLGRVASAVDVLCARAAAGTDRGDGADAPDEAAELPAEGGRGDPGAEPAHARAACLITLSDALGDLGRARSGDAVRGA